MSKKFKLLSLGFERAERIRLAANQSELLRNESGSLIDRLQKVLLQHVESAQAIASNPRLSDQGKRAELNDLADKTNKLIEAIDPRPNYTRDEERADALVINKVAQTRERQKPKDDPISQLLAFQQDRERREWAENLRKESKAKHEAAIAKQTEEGAFLSDQERTWKDPLETLYLESTAAYTSEKGPFIRAMESAPWPVQILSDATLAKGNDLLAQAVAGDFLAAKAACQCKHSMATEIITQAQEIARNPLGNQPIDGEHIPTSDQDRIKAQA